MISQQPLVLVDGRPIRLQATPAPGQLQTITIGPPDLLDTVAPGLASSLLSAANTLVWGSKFRYLGPITALMTIRESGTDTLQITQHPVAVGAQITDHSFMDPARVDLTMMATNAQSQLWGEGYVQHVYNQLLALQRSRQTFPIQTGKRLYKNMLMASISLGTDQSTENALMLQISCQEVIMVQNSAVAMPAANQAAPQKTDGVAQGGPQQATETTTIPEIVVPGAIGYAGRLPPILEPPIAPFP